MLIFHNPDFVGAVVDHKWRVVTGGVVGRQVESFHPGSQEVLDQCRSIGDEVLVTCKPVEPPDGEFYRLLLYMYYMNLRKINSIRCLF